MKVGAEAPTQQVSHLPNGNGVTAQTETSHQDQRYMGSCAIRSGDEDLQALYLNNLK